MTNIPLWLNLIILFFPLLLSTTIGLWINILLRKINRQEGGKAWTIKKNFIMACVISSPLAALTQILLQGQIESYIYIEKITTNIESFHFNKMVANIYELTNYTQKIIEDKKVGKKILLDFVEIYAKLIHPVIPHISEEIWALFNNKGMVIEQKWPIIKKVSSSKDLEINIALQINGKTRSILKTKSTLSKVEIQKLAMKDNKLVKHLKNKEPKKIIFVPNKVLNIVL